MTEKEENKLLIHVDVDSPANLIDFYKLSGITYTQAELDTFYEVTFARALEFFERHGIKASFFVVGEELEQSVAVRAVIRKAHDAGHEIENHTYSHPYGLCNFYEKEMAAEISKCADVIKAVTGRRPIGFRAPGYSISSRLINVLEQQGYRYDSSGSWSLLNPALSIMHKILFRHGVKNTGFGNVSYRLRQKPYLPDRDQWIKKSTVHRGIWELPLPSTRSMLFPFYHNFNLWAPLYIGQHASNHIKRPCLIYLFHIIEFADLNDGLPSTLSVHPNLKRDINSKLMIADKIITNLKRRYKLLKTEDYIKFLDNQAATGEVKKNKNRLITTQL